MAEFADLISSLPLYQELDRAAGRDAIGASDVARLKGLVNDVADTAGPAMAQIPVTFRQYTVHDIRHCRNVIARMGDILPDETREKLNALEITFLLLAALLHDVGMVVSDQEKNETLLSEDFRRFRAEGHADRNKAIEEARASGNEPRARAIDDALLAEYYRRLHPERVRQFMERHLAGRLRYQEVDFADDLARLCESHAWGVEESNDARHPKNAVAQLEDDARFYGVGVNLQYLACILRLADILDFDRSRTPLPVFQHLDFSEPKSWEEWSKHLQVKGWKITPAQVAFDIPCTHPVFYVAVHEFLGWIDDELRQCRYLVENKPQTTADRYKLTLPHVVDRHKVRMADASYVAGAFRFQLEYENILTLLMDKSLYPDESLFLRELLQNALDACRRKEADMQVKGIAYTPKIVVWDKTDDPNDPRVIFQDNGVGMSQRIVEQYFLRVGRSYYRSPEFDAERQRLREHGKELDACSQFGIGILSCFLVGDRFEVETHQEGYEPLHIEIEGPSKYFVVKRLARPEGSVLYQKASSDAEDGPPKKTGTRITVHFRAGVGVDVWKTLDKFAVNVDYPIVTYCAGRQDSRTIPGLRWEEPIRWSKRVSDDALGEALMASIVPFSRWDFSRHLRGRSWFWLLRGSNGQPTPRSGLLEVGKELRLVGIPATLARIERSWPPSNRTYRDWFDRQFIPRWLKTELFEEVIARRINALDSGESLQHWSTRPDVITALLRGSIEWADQPVLFEPPAMRSIEAEQLAINSILIPSGVMDWSFTTARSKRILLLTPFLGGAQVDIRGPQVPHPAAHRLYIPAVEAEPFRQQYIQAVLLHGLELVVQYGRTPDWRNWFGELANAVLRHRSNRIKFIRAFGQLIEDTLGLATRVNGEIAYLSRPEIQDLSAGPILLAIDADLPQYILWRDPVNRFLLAAGEPRPGERVEVDLSSLPILRANN